MITRKAETHARPVISPYLHVQIELIKSAYRAIVKGESTPLVYVGVYKALDKVMNSIGVRSRGGRDNEFKEFIRFAAHLCIFMLIKCRLPQQCAAVHDVVLLSYI